MCGLDLSGPEAAGVLEAGTAVRTAESRRQNLLDRMRASQAEREALRLAASAPVPQVVQQQPVNVGQYPGALYQSAQSPAASVPLAHSTEPASLSALHAQLPPQALPPTSGGATADGRPRRSGIQILMLTVGVILVSIMAIFFVLLAYLVASLEVRSILTGAASIAVFGIAWLLHRRRLSGTAQGIAVLAIVLLLLDIWIVRANDLFGSATLDGWLYTGIATGLLAVALTAGFRMLPLRSLSISAALLGPVAVFALTIGILTTVDASEQIWAAFAAVGAAALAWRWIPLGALECSLVRALGFIAAGLAILPGSFGFPDLDGGAVIALAVIAVIWFGHLALSEFQVVGPTGPGGTNPAGVAPGVLDPSVAPDMGAPPIEEPADNAAAQPASQPRPDVTSALRSTPWQVFAALGLGLSIAAIGPALLLEANSPSDLFWIPVTATAMGAVVLAIVARLGRASDGASLLRLATAVPLAATALLAAPAAMSALLHLLSILTLRPFSLGVLEPFARSGPGSEWTAPVALIAVSLLTASALALLGHLRSSGWASLALGAIGLIGACLVLGTPALSGSGLLLVAVAALAATASGRIAWPYRLVAAITSALGTFGVFVVGLTSTVTFPFAVIATLAVLVVLHRVVHHTAPHTVASATTPVVVASGLGVLLGSVLLAPSWYQTVTEATSAPAAPALALVVCAAVIVLTVLFAPGLLTRAESAVAVSIGGLATFAGLLWLAARISADATPFLIASGIAAGVTILWQFPRRVAAWPERYVAAAAAPVTALGFVAVLWDQIDDAVTPVAVSSAIVVLAALALAVFRPTHNSAAATLAGILNDPARIARACWDVPVVLVAAFLVPRAVGSERLGWLALLLLAVAAVIIASGDGGVFAGRSLRRHVAWAGLPLAVGSLWLGLARNDVDVVEFYTLPVSGLLFAILALIVIRREPVTDRVSSPRTVLFGAALAVALLPSAAASGTDEPVRMAITLGAAILLLLAGPFLPPVWAATRVAVVVWFTGVVTMLLLTLVLPVVDSTRTPGGWENEVAAAGLAVGGALWLYRRRVPHILGTLAVAAAPVVLALPLAESILAGEAEFWRFLLTLLLASALFVAASLGAARSEIIRWTALGAAVIVAASAMTVGLADPFETATVPIAVALIAVGAVRLSADPAARSWPHLGAGLILLLVPSLFADFASNELWRVVALGVAALVVFGIGLALKLSAPTLIGAAVLVVHGLAQLWPWISGLYGAIPWWLWAGIGGVILIVLAATYEKRIRDLQAVARSIRSLR
ncbi:hypothetical protein C3E77_08625 [Mycetocola zhujimingii]|nr:hypothetical protein C3E77_08625 [Mycetocola zhujimingii]